MLTGVGSLGHEGMEHEARLAGNGTGAEDPFSNPLNLQIRRCR
jgi:hypothetical protein